MKNRLSASGAKIAWLVMGFLVLGALVTAGLVYYTEREMREALLVQSNMVAGAVNIERVKGLTGTSADLQSPDYLRLKKQFAAIRASNPKCRFAYLMGRRADGTVFFFLDEQDDSREDSPPSQPGDVYAEATPELIAGFTNGTPFIEGPVSDEWGTFVSGLVPLIDPQTGQCLAVMGLDLDADEWLWNLAARAAVPVTLVLLVLIGLVVLASSDTVSSSPRPILRRLLPGLLLLLVLIFVLAEGMLWRMHRQILHERRGSMTMEIERDLHNALDLQAQGLAAALHAITADDRARQGLQSGDRDRLLADWKPLYETLHKEQALTHFYFFDAKRACRLRLHKPEEKSGDRIDRFTAREAERTGKTASGIELGPLGTFTLRVVTPVFDGTTLVGYVELGKEIEDVLRTIRADRPGVDLAVAIRKQALKREVWESGMRMLGREADWDRLSGNVIIYASQGRVPDEFAVFVDHHDPAGGRDHRATREIAVDNAVWCVMALPLKDASGTEVGDLLIMDDITALKDAFIRNLIVTFAVGTILLALLSAVVFVLLRHTDAGVSAQQAKLSESEKLLSRAEEIGETGSWKLDLRTQLCTWSEGSYRLLGCSPENVSADYKTFMELVHPDDRATVDEAYARSRREGKDDCEIEYRIVRRDSGEVRVFHEHYVHERDDTGTVVKTTGMAQDVTERKSAEEKLRQNEEKFRSLFASMTEMVVLHELVFTEHGDVVNYRVTDCNPAFEKFLGLKAEEIIGRLATDLYRTETAPFLDIYGHTALTGEFRTFSSYFPPWTRVSRYGFFPRRKTSSPRSRTTSPSASGPKPFARWFMRFWRFSTSPASCTPASSMFLRS